MKARLTLLAILALGLGFRVWGLAFGLPHLQSRPDEIAVVSLAMGFLQGEFWPAFFDYPRVAFYLFAATYGVYGAIGQMVGWFTSFGDFTSTWKQWWPPLFLLARSVSAVCGMLTIVALYRLAADVFNRRVALVASCLLAVAFLAVRESHYATTDAPMTLLAWIALGLFVRAYDTSRLKTLSAGTLFAALALSTKYSAAPLVLSVVAVIGLLRLDGRISTRKALGQVLLLALFGIVVFLALNPYVIFDWDRFRAAMNMLADSYGSGMRTAVPLPPGWIFHVTVSLRHGLGLPILAAGFIGFGIFAWRRPASAVIVGVFALGFYVAIGRSNLLFVRYALPLVPLFCLGAAIAVEAVVERIPRRVSSLVACLLALALAAPSVAASIAFDRLMVETDSRTVAAGWIGAHVPSGARIAQSGSEYGHVPLPGGRGYRHWAFNAQLNSFVERRLVPVQGTPDYIVVQESALPYSYVVPQMQQMLAVDYDLVHVVRATNKERQAANVYDLHDAFFLPYAGFRGVSRPGPNLYIWQRRAGR